MNGELPANLWTFRNRLCSFSGILTEIWIFKGVMDICRIERLFVFEWVCRKELKNRLSLLMIFSNNKNSWIFWVLIHSSEILKFENVKWWNFYLIYIYLIHRWVWKRKYNATKVWNLLSFQSDTRNSKFILFWIFRKRGGCRLKLTNIKF